MRSTKELFMKNVSKLNLVPEFLEGNHNGIGETSAWIISGGIEWVLM